MRKEIIGNQTLYLGDCLEIMPTLGKVDAVVTDPPYGTKNKSSWNGKHGDCMIINDESIDVRDFVLKSGLFDRALVFGSWRMPRPENTKQILIWNKGGHCGMGDLSIPWKPNFEEIYVIGSGFKGSRTSGILNFISDRECNGVVRERFHPTEKPIPLMKELISKTPGLIFDPFMGSGTTLVACQQMGRQGIGIEIDPQYFQIACERVHNAYMQPDLFIGANQ